MKCQVCYREHGELPFPKFDKPVYWTLPDDGATIKCADCNEQHACKDVYLTQLTCGSRKVICMFCIDEDWLTLYATSMGAFKD